MEFTEETIDANEAIDIRDYVRVIVKRRRMIISLFSCILAAGLISTFTATPIYEATASIIIEKEKANIVTFSEFMSEDLYGVEYYQTQYKILESRAVARKVIQQLGLDKNEKFCPKGDTKKQNTGDAAQKEDADEGLIAAFLGGLNIEPERNTRIVHIKYQSPDPGLATELANAVVVAYIDHTLETKLQSVANEVKWLNDNMEVERKKVEAAEEALLRYKQEHGIVTDFSGDTETITAQKLAQLNVQVVEAETARVEAETRYNQAMAFAQNPLMLGSIPEVISNDMVRQIMAAEFGLLQRKSEMSKKYGAHHPQMEAIESELKTLQPKKEQAMNRVVNALNNAYKIARAKENSLKEALAAQKSESLNLNQKSIEYANLHRNAQSAKEMYGLLLKRFKEKSFLENMNTDNIRIVDKAEVPQSPIKPQKARNIFIAFFLGLGIALGMAFLLEYLDDAIGVPEDLERYVQIPFLGIVPRQAVKAAAGQEAETPPEMETFHSPRSKVSEAYRGIRANIFFSQAEKEPQVILVSSSVAQEGKTTAAINIATVMAQYGYRVVLIDCDFHRGQLRKLFGIKHEEGMTNLLVGNKELKDALFETHIPNLHVIPAGRTPPNPSEILGSTRMQALLAQLQQDFDKIIIDSPPLIPVTDSLVAAKAVEGVVIVVRAGKTARGIVRSAVESLERIGAHVFGAVLLGVDTAHHGYYSQQYYGYTYTADGESEKKKQPKIKNPFLNWKAGWRKPDRS